MQARLSRCTNLVESDLVLSHFEFEGFRTVLPALRLRSGQAPAGIQGEQAAACGYSAWIPAFAGMTQHSSTPQNHPDRLLVFHRTADEGCHSEPKPFDKLRINSAKAKNLGLQ